MFRARSVGGSRNMAHGPWKPGCGRFSGLRHVSIEWISLPPEAETSEKTEKERVEPPGDPKKPEGYAAAGPCRTERFVTDWVMEE